MACVTVFPGLLSGDVAAPPSKSFAHRALIAAALAEGVSEVGPIAPSEDLLATIGGIEALGVKVLWRGEGVRVEGIGGRAPGGEACIDAGESGSTLRFLLPVALSLAGGARFVGRGRLGERPLYPYEALCRAQGIAWRRAPGEALDLRVEGALCPGEYALPGDVSSQFVTGLLMALPLLPGDSALRIRGALQSAAYVDMTLSVLARFGVTIERRGEGHFFIAGRQRYRARAERVEGDYSQAAVFLTAAALGARVRVTNLNKDSAQGDRAILSILEAMGARVRWDADGVTVSADALHGLTIDASGCPDIIPIAALAAALARGQTRIVRAERLRIKECDRLTATVEAINALGGRAREAGDEILLEGVDALIGGNSVSASNDHRMAMLLTIGALNARLSVDIQGAECVRKSYPDFYREIIRLGGAIDGIDVG